ncbi:anhydro-N-acetylmuramic acid kinase, partial [Glaciecola sp.]|nr:anhydro-N-acetylmuramic acid kinase [Glaciecola sp.]
ESLAALMQPDLVHSVAKIGTVQQALTCAFAQAVNTLLQEQNISPDSIKAIGCHGQTIWHAPDALIPFSIQLNNAALLAALTQIDVVDDFRANDLAHDGQGAPLVPPFHQALFMPYPTNVARRVIINIGGIANVTILPTSPTGITRGFDTGPGNTLLDSWSELHTGHAIDIDGRWGSHGTCNTILLNKLLADPYFALPAPKSTGREYFNLQWLKQQLADYQTLIPALSPQDVQATLVELTSVSIAQAIAKHLASPEHGDRSDHEQQLGQANQHKCEWIICGGGVHNAALLQQLQSLCSEQNATLTDMHSLGYDADAIEAMAFAWLAYCYDAQIPANSPAVTGAKKSVILGAKTYA